MPTIRTARKRAQGLLAWRNRARSYASTARGALCHRDEGLVGVMIVHHRAAARFGPAIAEIESLADFDRSERGRLVADRRRQRAPGTFGQLKSDDIVEGTLATRHLAVGQPAVKPLEVFETGHTLDHLGPGQCDSR